MNSFFFFFPQWKGNASKMLIKKISQLFTVNLVAGGRARRVQRVGLEQRQVGIVYTKIWWKGIFLLVSHTEKSKRASFRFQICADSTENCFSCFVNAFYINNSLEILGPGLVYVSDARLTFNYLSIVPCKVCVNDLLAGLGRDKWGEDFRMQHLISVHRT